MFFLLPINQNFLTTPYNNELMKPTKVIKKSHFIVITMLSITITASAQLKVNNFGRVGIGNVSPNQNTCLIVGSNQYNSFGGSFGISAAPISIINGNNIGIAGRISANLSFTSDKNYGIIGIVDQMNNSHGRNYGICGMIGPQSDLL